MRVKAIQQQQREWRETCIVRRLKMGLHLYEFPHPSTRPKRKTNDTKSILNIVRMEFRRSLNHVFGEGGDILEKKTKQTNKKNKKKSSERFQKPSKTQSSFSLCAMSFLKNLGAKPLEQSESPPINQQTKV
jgi:hypothetical protein